MRKTGMENSSGNAMVEFAVLLPVYVLLLIGLLFFANEILFWQEGQLAARFLATNDRAAVTAPSGTASPLIAVTSGPLVPQDYFLFGSMQGQPQISRDTRSGDFTQADLKAELVKSSWSVTGSFTFGGDVEAVGQSLTQQGNVVYGNKPNLFQAVPGQYSFDGDDALIAEELSGWFNRRSATVTLTHDSRFLRVGKWTLPAASVTAEGRSVVRETGNKQRSVTASQSGYRKPIEDLIAKFGSDEVSAGDLAKPDYPDFGGSDAFWVPN